MRIRLWRSICFHTWAFTVVTCQIKLWGIVWQPSFCFCHACFLAVGCWLHSFWQHLPVKPLAKTLRVFLQSLRECLLFLCTRKKTGVVTSSNEAWSTMKWLMKIWEHSFEETIQSYVHFGKHFVCQNGHNKKRWFFSSHSRTTRTLEVQAFLHQ